MKVCRKCKENKPFTEYHKDSSKEDGYVNWCKKCVNISQKRRQDLNLSRDIVVVSKICRTCKIEKKADSFVRERRNKDGLCGYCNDCRKIREKNRRRIKKETYKNSCRVSSLIKTGKLNRPCESPCAYGGCNTSASQYHHIKYDDLDKGDNLSIITPVCRYHHDTVEIYKNDGIDLSNKFSTRIQIERFGTPKPSKITYLSENIT